MELGGGRTAPDSQTCSEPHPPQRGKLAPPPAPAGALPAGTGGSCCCQVPQPGLTSFPCIPGFAPACGCTVQGEIRVLLPEQGLQPRVCLVPAGGRWDVRGARPVPAAREGRGWSQSLWLRPCGSLWRLMPAPGQGSQVRFCSRAGITGTFLNTPLHPRGLPGASREGGREPGGQSGAFCFCCSSSKVFSIPLDVLWGQRELLCLWRGSPCPFTAGSTKKWEMGNSRGAVPEGGDPET